MPEAGRLTVAGVDALRDAMQKRKGLILYYDAGTVEKPDLLGDSAGAMAVSRRAGKVTEQYSFILFLSHGGLTQVLPLFLFPLEALVPTAAARTRRTVLVEARRGFEQPEKAGGRRAHHVHRQRPHHRTRPY